MIKRKLKLHILFSKTTSQTGNVFLKRILLDICFLITLLIRFYECTDRVSESNEIEISYFLPLAEGTHKELHIKQQVHNKLKIF